MNQRILSLISRLPSDSLTVIRGNDLVLRNGDVHYPFRQDSDFLYLTGLSVPGLVVTIFLTPNPSPKREGNSGNSPSLKEKGLGDEVVILWREPIGEKDIIWGSDKLSDEELGRISGITDIRDIADMEEYISKVALCSVMSTTETSCSESLGKISPDVEMTDTDTSDTWRSIVHKMRTVKTPDEIAKIQNCIRITESIYQAVLENIKPGMYEYEIEALIAYGFRRHHGTEAFPTIVASGLNSCTLHYTANTRQIEAGDIVLLDFGIELHGYGADISRTFVMPGFHLSEGEGVRGGGRFQEIYDAVLDVRDFAEHTLVPGITRRAWAIRVKEYMYEVCTRLELENIENYTAITNPYFPHSIGHFLGLDTHDVGDSDMPLAPGMILTIEPGIYIPSEAIGIRIEDDYLVTESGCVKL